MILCAVPAGPGWMVARVCQVAPAFLGLWSLFIVDALVLQLLAERTQLKSPHGRAAFGILLFQDLAVLPVLAALPLIAPTS